MSLALLSGISATETLGTLHEQSVMADSPKHLDDALTLIARKDGVAFDRMVADDAAMICDSEMEVVVDQSTAEWIKFHIKEHPELTFFTAPSSIDLQGSARALSNVTHPF
jgi:hypothetical protein